MQTYTIKTLGCKNNQYESNIIMAKLQRAGLQSLPFGETADYVVINTCTVTDSSDHKCRQYIRAGAKTAKNGRVIVTGCLANRAKDELMQMREVAAVYTSDEIPDMIMSIGGISENQKQFELPVGRSRAQLKIQDGCDGTCSYCIIPAVRGLPRSRDLQEILDEAGFYIANGYRELVITGITIGKYQNGGDFASLIERILNLPGDFRVRITSIEPVHVSGRLLDLYSHPKLCPHIHLPLQGGDNGTLRNMNRPYTTEEYLEKIEALRKINPDIAIGTDVIVGFPGEAEKDFSNALSFISAIGFSYIHQFTFSPRQGTPAAMMLQNASPEEIASRFERLKLLAALSREHYISRFLTKELPCVIERRGNKLRALTPHYLHVNIINTESDVRTGEFAMVRLIDQNQGIISGFMLLK